LSVPHPAIFHPLKAKFAAGAGVKVTSLFAAAPMEHWVALLRTPLVMVQVFTVVPTCSLTVPLPPLPDTLEILMVKGPLLNLAVTLRSIDMLTLQAPVPIQPAALEVHPAKACPNAEVAVSTTVPLINFEQPVAAATPLVI
jgi:hypothetical protein